MITKMKADISLYAVLRRILNELNEQVVDHGERVAYLYLKMAQYRCYQDDDHMERIMLTCYAHDIGAYKTEKFLDLLRFDVTHTLEHCIYGYLFMKYFSPLKDDAEVLLYHHTFFSDRHKHEGPYIDDGILIHFLDRIDILHIKYEDDADIIKIITESSGKNFNPVDVDDFIKANEEYRIIDHLRDGSYKKEVQAYFDYPDRILRLLKPTIGMLTSEVDFRSEQTVIHTITTALLAKKIAMRFCFDAMETEVIEYAARIHDLGKISVPQEIVEKPGKLTSEEYEEIKKHVIYTKKITEDLFPEKIVDIAYKHHERLDGSGYPHGLKSEDIELEARILQIADVTSALLQKRSYKDVMDKETVIAILEDEVAKGKLDDNVMKIFLADYDEIIDEVCAESRDTIDIYENLQIEYRKYLVEYENIEPQLEEFELLPSGNL